MTSSILFENDPARNLQRQVQKLPNDFGQWIPGPDFPIQQKAHERLREIETAKTQIIEAFIAEHGCKPGEAALFIEPQPNGGQKIWVEKRPPAIVPAPAADRKGEPVFSGVMQYFPRALRAVSRVSKAGNDKHNPGQPLHWAHDKSCDQPDAAARHMLTPYETDLDTGEMHLAHAAWRVLAWLEMTLWALEEEHDNMIGDFQKIGAEMADEYK